MPDANGLCPFPSQQMKTRQVGEGRTGVGRTGVGFREVARDPLRSAWLRALSPRKERGANPEELGSWGPGRQEPTGSSSPAPPAASGPAQPPSERVGGRADGGRGHAGRGGGLVPPPAACARPPLPRACAAGRGRRLWAVTAGARALAYSSRFALPRRD